MLPSWLPIHIENGGSDHYPDLGSGAVSLAYAQYWNHPYIDASADLEISKLMAKMMDDGKHAD